MNSFGPQASSTPVQGTFCTQANGEQGVINDRGQCVSQAPLFAPSTMHLFNINNVANPEYNLNASDYGDSALGYIGNVDGVDNSGGNTPNGSLSGWDQAAMMDKARQEVERAYQLYLGREADSRGLDYWSEKVQTAALHKNPNEIQAVMNAIKNSPEGKAYAASQAAPVTPVTPVTPPVVCPEGQTLNEAGECVSSGPTNLPEGTYLGKQCSGTTMITLTADGQGGSVQSAAPNSAECGYQAPAPAPAAPAPVDLGNYTYTSPVNAGVGTVTGNAGGSGIGAVSGYTYSPYQMQQGQNMTQGAAGQPVDYVKMLQGWLTNSLFQDII